MSRYRHLASTLAQAVLAGDKNVPAINARIERCLELKASWIPALSQEILSFYGEGVADSVTQSQVQQLSDWLISNARFHQIWLQYRPTPKYYFLNHRLFESQIDQSFSNRYGLPKFYDERSLADFLQVDEFALRWYADIWQATTRSSQSKLCHYRYRQLVKSDGSPRLLEIPKQSLKTLQSKLLRGLLDKIPLHPAAHGFVKNKSCRSHAEIHAGKSVVVLIDLKDFFTSISAARIYSLYQRLGYHKPVASLLKSLSTTRAPFNVVNTIHDYQIRQKYTCEHLPQGAPTSPCLANLVAYSLDCRLSALARKFGFQYSRYADDLAFSSDVNSRQVNGRLIHWAKEVIRDEGFRINERKTRVVSQAARQKITGIVVNEGLNIERKEFDNLKATLHNCMKKGTASQNRVGHHDFKLHLQGRISAVAYLNKNKGRKLQLMFDQLTWKN